MASDDLASLACLFQWLQDQSHRCSTDTFRRDAFEQLRAAIAFDHAIWADANVAESLSLRSADLYGFERASLREIEMAASTDPRLPEVLKAQRQAHAYRVQSDDPPNYRTLMEQLEIDQVLSIASFDASRGSAAGIVLCRRTNPFTVDACRFLEAAFPLLLNAWMNCQIAEVRRHNNSAPVAPVYSAAARQALLITAEPKFVDLLRLEWPAWSGPHLPRELTTEMPNKLAELYVGAKIVIRSKTSVDTTLVTVRHRLGVDDLTQRERLVAELCSQGKTYREIAVVLGLAPSTTRNHISSIHRRLGVSRNNEIANQLASTGYLNS